MKKRNPIFLILMEFKPKKVKNKKKYDRLNTERIRKSFLEDEDKY